MGNVEPTDGALVEVDPAVTAGPLAGLEPTLHRLVRAWLLTVRRGPQHSRHTDRAYEADLAQFFRFLDEHRVDPLRVRNVHTDAWRHHLSVAPSARTGRPVRQATLARKISTIASFYRYLVDEGLVEKVPVRTRGRPQMPTESTTVGMSLDEWAAFQDKLAQLDWPAERAILHVLAYTGLRVEELCALTVGSLGHTDGRPVLILFGKGGKRRVVPLEPTPLAAVNEVLAGYAAELDCKVEDIPGERALFVRENGTRFNQQAVYRLVQRVARAAGIPSWRKLSPHSLRHTLTTLLLDQGEQIHIVAGLMGHASPATTQRYDRSRGSVARGAPALGRLSERLKNTRENTT